MKKKKIIILIILLVLGSIGIRKLDLNLRYGMGMIEYYKYNAVFTSKEEEFLKEKPLLVGVDNDPPLAYLNEFNSYNTGIMVDYLSQLAIELGNDIHLKVGSKEYLDEALNGKEIDLAVMEKTFENEKKFDMTHPLCVVKGKIIVKNNLDIDNIVDLKDKTLVSLKSDNVNGRINNYFEFKNNIDIMEVENIYQCFA